MFPDRVDRKLALGDACPQSGECPGHQGAHSNLKQIDFNYYTFDRNRTHYTESDEDRAIIWDRGKLTENYDWDRNALLWVGIRKRIPKFRNMIDERMYPLTYSKFRNKYGITMGTKLREIVNLTSPGKYHHDLHCHGYY